MCVGETYALTCEPVDIRSLDILGSVASKVAIAEVVGKDDDDVGAVGVDSILHLLGSVGCLCSERCEKRDCQIAFLHCSSMFILVY